MSNHLAIATVTATLCRILEEALSQEISGATATSVRPNAPANQLPNPGVNIYLYQVTPNAAWRNADLPTRSADGGLIQQPRAALDLHYLLSFYGDEASLEPQRVLGVAIRVLHEQPILPRNKIREVINATTSLTGSNLDEEIELVKLTQIPLSLEELSKLWSVFFQTAYVLSVAFQASVVLIDGKGTPRATLPVRARNVYVAPFRHPVIERIEPAAGSGQPIVTGSSIRIVGANLRGDVTRVRFGEIVVEPSADQISDTQIQVTLPAGLRAGVQSVQVEHLWQIGTPPAPHSGIESNVAAFVLQPAVTSWSVSNVTSVVVGGLTLRSATITAQFNPAVGRSQRVRLLLYEFNAPGNRPPHTYVFEAPPANGITDPAQAETDTIDFKIERVSPGTYLARVQVDGAESPLEVDSSGPTVTI